MAFLHNLKDLSADRIAIVRNAYKHYPSPSLLHKPSHLIFFFLLPLFFYHAIQRGEQDRELNANFQQKTNNMKKEGESRAGAFPDLSRAEREGGGTDRRLGEMTTREVSILPVPVSALM